MIANLSLNENTISPYWYHLEGQMLPMFFWKFNTHRSWNHFIAMLYWQLSGSNHPLNVTTSVSSGWPRKWGRGNVKSSNSGKNHPILTSDPSECLSKCVLLRFIWSTLITNNNSFNWHYLSRTNFPQVLALKFMSRPWRRRPGPQAQGRGQGKGQSKQNWHQGLKLPSPRLYLSPHLKVCSRIPTTKNFFYVYFYFKHHGKRHKPLICRLKQYKHIKTIQWNVR